METCKRDGGAVSSHTHARAKCLPLAGCPRLEAVRVVLAGGGGVEDPLDNEEQLGEQMEALPYLCRFQYEQTTDYLAGIIDPLIAAYSKASAGGAPPRPAFHCAETTRLDPGESLAKKCLAARSLLFRVKLHA